MKLYINLLNFCDYKLAGAGYYFKRIINSLDFDQPKWAKYQKIVLLVSSQVDVLELFNIKPSKRIQVKRVRFVNHILYRIMYEQLYLPIRMSFSKGVFFSPTPAVPFVLARINRDMVVIPTIHDMIPFRVPNKYTFLRSIYIKGISILVAKFSSKIITVSEYSKKDIAEIAKVNPEKIAVIYNFVTEFSHVTNCSDEGFFLTLSTVEPGKNIENMLRGFAEFLNQFPVYSHMTYKFAGKLGWNYDPILQLVKDLNLNNKVEFLGYVSDQEKANLLATCTAVVYLSLYEGFGIPPLEGMYFNKVSIVSDNSSLPEVVGKAGIVQDVMDYKKLAENMNHVIVRNEFYTRCIPLQLQKFSAVREVEKFTFILTGRN